MGKKPLQAPTAAAGATVLKGGAALPTAARTVPQPRRVKTKLCCCFGRNEVCNICLSRYAEGRFAQDKGFLGFASRGSFQLFAPHALFCTGAGWRRSNRTSPLLLDGACVVFVSTLICNMNCPSTQVVLDSCQRSKRSWQRSRVFPTFERLVFKVKQNGGACLLFGVCCGVLRAVHTEHDFSCSSFASDFACTPMERLQSSPPTLPSNLPLIHFAYTSMWRQTVSAKRLRR